VCVCVGCVVCVGVVCVGVGGCWFLGVCVSVCEIVNVGIRMGEIVSDRKVG
jgi:hypothetical protein